MTISFFRSMYRVSPQFSFLAISKLTSAHVTEQPFHHLMASIAGVYPRRPTRSPSRPRATLIQQFPNDTIDIANRLHAHHVVVTNFQAKFLV